MKIKKGILLLFTGMVLLLLFIFFTSIPQQKSFLKSEVVSQLTESDMVTSSLLLLMSTEIPQLKPHLEENDISAPRLSHLLFKMTSGITPSSYTSLIQGEVPGLDSYAKGVNLSDNSGDLASMPIESPPPDFESLLEEEEEREDDAPEPDEDEKIDENKKKEVFIYHSHSSEAFLPLLDKKKKPSEASSTDNKANIVYVGSMLTKQLEKMGVGVDHDKTNVIASLHERGLDWNDSYQFSREKVQEVMGEKDSLQYFIDIHRDSQRKDVTTAKVDGKGYAKVFFTVGVAHENYEENLQFAEELNNKIDENYPGISRGVYKKDKSQGNGVYNQDLSDRSILIEVGGVDNTEEELKNTTDALAEVLGDYIIDAEKVDG